MSSNWPEKYKHHSSTEDQNDGQDPELLYKFTELDYPSVNVDRAWDELSSKIGPKPTFSINIVWKVAAILLLTSAISFTVFQVANVRPDEKLTEIRTLENPQTYRLPDGSRVTLSANSTLAYNKNDFLQSRNISFEGQGFFEVIKGNSTFTVSTSNAEVSVLGTSFSVETADNVNIFVKTGLVSVETSKSKKKVTPGQMAVTTKNGEISIQKNTDPNILSWKTGVFVFDNTKLQEALPYLEKYYNVNFHVNEELSSCAITAKFEKRSLEELVDVLSTVLDAKSRVSGDEINFTGTGCK